MIELRDVRKVFHEGRPDEHVALAGVTISIEAGRVTVLRGWSTLYPDFRLVPVVDPYQLATLFFLTVVPYTVATVVPCWRAATIDPDSVMRT